MPKRALVEHRPWLLASLASALAFYVLTDGQFEGIVRTMLKGGACAFLAVYAWQRHRSIEAKLIALYLALSSLADMALEVWFEVGGALFFAAHLAGISLYLQCRRHHTTASQKLFAAVLLLATPFICWQLSGEPAIGLYGAALGGMAASAWLSRFPRYRVGVGAVLFVVSDLLIFARIGGRLEDAADLLVWPVYFIAQFMIGTGVVRTLRGELRASVD